jgi:hypothetical protein
MAGMRNDVRPQLLAGAGAILLTLAALTGCTPAGGTGRAASEAPVTSSPPAPHSTAPTPTETADPLAGAAPNLVPTRPGDCAVDRGAHGVVTFVVTADDDTTPIDVTYSAFRPGVLPEVRTATVVGPSVVMLQTDCGEYGAWTFTAASATTGSLSCGLFFGGMHLAHERYYAEGATDGGTVDCSVTPGM